MLVNVEHDWALQMSEWAYAYGKPTLSGCIKKAPEDFQVTENLALEPTGQGEHIVLQITKKQQNTDAVAKALARHAKVAYRDVGYSGLKDFNAVTQQWFSIYQPKEQQIDWAAFDINGVNIDQVDRHSRKIKRGTHRSNHFKVRVRDVDGDLTEFENKVTQFRQCGGPNYFGVQRFGRSLNNMQQARALLVEGHRFKNRNLKSILYSSARSWLFNCIVSERIKANNWTSLYPQEPVNLNRTNSLFTADNDSTEQARLDTLDIHPTAPMWGNYNQAKVIEYSALHEFEKSVIQGHADLCVGLENANLTYQRRAIRMQIEQLDYVQEGKDIVLSFSLHKGQYATSVLRELFLT